MSEDFTRVTKASMTAGIDALEGAQKALREELNDLESKLQSSLAQWDGAGQAAYREAKSKWDASAQKMAEVVLKMRSTLSMIDENYTSTERAVQGSWGG